MIIPPIFPEHIKAIFTTKNSHEEIFRFGLPVYRPVQRHTEEVIILDGTERKIADGVITEKKGIIIGIETADCVPILLCDPTIPVIGAVHAGWRGTAKGIIKNAIKKMKEFYSSDPSKIFIAIGPSIGPCCYEVDEPVKDAVSRLTGSHYESRNGKYYLNLSMENILQALSEGVKRENIWYSGECTRCNPQRFYSYRFSKNEKGRQGGFIFIEI